LKRDEWNRKYARDDFLWSTEPARLLVAEADDLAPGRALDLACGEGRNAVWLAQKGWAVTAVDFSEVALAKARRLAQHRNVTVDWVAADLLDWRPSGTFDLVLVFFLQLPREERSIVLRKAASSVASGGTLLVLGHDLLNLTEGHGGPTDPEVLFTPDEVADELPELVVERAERVRRPVPAEGGAVAVDALVRATRRRRQT
jgi:SAM-dependent methyltransferase